MTLNYIDTLLVLGASVRKPIPPPSPKGEGLEGELNVSEKLTTSPAVTTPLLKKVTSSGAVTLESNDIVDEEGFLCPWSGDNVWRNWLHKNESPLGWPEIPNPESSLDPTENNSTRPSPGHELFYLRAYGKIKYIPAGLIVTSKTKQVPARQKALNEARLSSWLSDKELDVNKYILTSFHEYLEKIKNRRLVFRKKGVKGGAPSTYLSPSRFGYAYQNKVKASLRPLLTEHNFRNCVMLTLTLDHMKTPNKIEAWQNIGVEIDRFLTLLFRGIATERTKKYRRLNPKKYNDNVAFEEYKYLDNIVVVEAQQNGYPHAHILFFNVRRLLDWRVIRDMWGLGHTYIDKTEEGVKISNPVAYMFKYITKTFTKTIPKNELTHAYLWFFYRRSYHTSQGLVKPLSSLKNGTTGEYELVGMLICDDKTLKRLESNTQLFDALIKGLG